MEPLLLLSVVISFIASLLLIPSWIRRARKAGLVGRDMNKFKQKEVAEAGGITVVSGFILGTLVYIAIKIFYFKTSSNLVEIFALISVILIVSFMGFIDDVLGWKMGLGKKIRIFFVLFSAIPLMVINAGYSKIGIPFLDGTNLGLLYPLIIIPLGIAGASISFNFLAGYNGLEAGQGILLLSAFAVFSWLTGSSWLSVIALCMIASLFAFLFFNKFPAKIFPGNTMTYAVGALIAVMAILGNYEYFAIFIFIPYILETLLKLRGKLIVESFGKPQKDGSLEPGSEKICGLENLAIRILKKIKPSKKVYETEVVLFIHIFQIFRDKLF